MIFALVLLAAAGVAGTFIVLALQENLTYLHTPTDVRDGNVPTDARFRLGGVVCEGSVRRTEGSLLVQFAVTDRIRQVPVRYQRHSSGHVPRGHQHHRHRSHAGR